MEMFSVSMIGLKIQKASEVWPTGCHRLSNRFWRRILGLHCLQGSGAEVMRAETSFDSFRWLIGRVFHWNWSFDRTHIAPARITVGWIVNKYLHAKTELIMNEAWNYRFWLWPHAATRFAPHKSFQNANSSAISLFKEHQQVEQKQQKLSGKLISFNICSVD